MHIAPALPRCRQAHIELVGPALEHTQSLPDTLPVCWHLRLARECGRETWQTRMHPQPSVLTVSPPGRAVLRVRSPAANVVMLRQSARDPESEPARCRSLSYAEHAAGVVVLSSPSEDRAFAERT